MIYAHINNHITNPEIELSKFDKLNVKKMKTIDIQVNINDLDIDYRFVPEQKQTLEQEGIPSHIEFNYIKFRGVDISDLVDEIEIEEYLKDLADDI